MEHEGADLKEGDIVTLALAKSAKEIIPKHIIRVRKDVTWKEILKSTQATNFTDKKKAKGMPCQQNGRA